MKPTREEVLRLMRQASGGILTQVAEDPRCGYEIKVEELQTFAALLQAKNNSDHVAVISAKPDSVHLAVPVETATDTSLHTASGLYFDMEDAMRREYEEGAMLNQIRGIVENAGKRDTEEGGEVQIYEAELAYIDSILDAKIGA